MEDYEKRAMAPEARRHFDGFLELARTASTHQRCMEYIQYCSGFIGALTITRGCTLEEHQEAWAQIDEVRNRSFTLMAQGVRR